MKTRCISFISVMALLLTLFSFSASAEKVEDYNIDFSLPNEFIVLTEENAAENTEALKSLGFTASSFKSYINSNNIIFFASLSDKSCQISVNAVKTNFSQQTEDLDYLDDEYIARLLPNLIGDDVSSNEIKVINGTKFIRTENSGSDKAGEFSYLQYITVKNKLLYTVTVSFSGNTLSDNNIDYSEILMKTLTISKQKEKINIGSVQNIAIYVILICIIILLAVVVIYIIYTFVADIIKNRNTSDVAPYVKIKRRRFK